MKYENILLYGLLVIVVFGLFYSVYTFYENRYGSNYQKYISSENNSNICATPSGYTDDEWITHMSHHPDKYKQCLGE